MGILNQKTDFEVELVIADDASKDATPSIIEEIIRAYPTKNIVFHHHEQNMGMIANFVFCLNQCRGKYIAVCEGDDYWIDTGKLQKQVDFLDENPEFEMCFTNVSVLNLEGTLSAHKNKFKKSDYSHRDMPIWSPTLTRVFKNRDFNVLLPGAPGMDQLMLLYQSTLGKIKYLDEVTGVYRITGAGAYTSQKVADKKMHNIATHLACIRFVENDLKKRYFGYVLKLLLDLKTHHHTKYSEGLTILKQAFKDYRKGLSAADRIKIHCCISIVRFGTKGVTQGTQKLSKLFISKLLVY